LQERLKIDLTEVASESLQNEQHPQNVAVENSVILDQVLRSASVGQSGISTSYLIELLPSVLNSLRQEGFLTDNLGDGKHDDFSLFLSTSHEPTQILNPH
jgi:hypothetical protein